MTDFDDLLDSATPLTKDVDIYIDGGLVAERDRLLQQFRDAKDDDDARAGQKPFAVRVQEELEELQARMADRVLTIRIWQMPGTAWASLKGRFPLKAKRDENSSMDLTVGFNTEAVARHALLKSAKRVKDDGETEALTSAQWSKLFDTISGGDFDRLIVETININQLVGQAQTEQVLKASRRTGGSETK